MTVFQYKGINTDGKEVTGSLDAPTIESARSALESMHVEVQEVHEATRANRAQSPENLKPTEVQMKSFAFEGKESSGNIRRGTIQAENKYSAFSKLKHDQNLFVSMLSPVGVTPQFRDNDLENWQRSSKASASTSGPVNQKKTLQFAISPTPPLKENTQSPKVSSVHVERYAPIVATLRLYSGWLMAWYGLFVALGYYVSEREFPFEVPLVRSFYLSPLIFSFVGAIFFFLLLSSLHKNWGGGLIKGILLSVVGIVLFVGVRISVA